MINRELQHCIFRRFKSYIDDYGQTRKLYEDIGSEDCFVKFYSSVLAPNPGYTDVDYIVLTKRRDLTPSDFLVIDGKNYRIVYVVPSRKYLELFIRETNESPVDKFKLNTPTNLYITQKELGFDAGCLAPEYTGSYRYEFYSVSPEESRGTYNTTLNPFGLGYFVSDFSTGDYKFRVKAYPAPEYSDLYKESDWSEFFEFHLDAKLPAPTFLSFEENEYDYYFSWLYRGTVTLFTTEIWKGDTRIGSYPGTFANLLIPKATLTLEPGDYKYRVKASKSGYTDSDWSEWCEFSITVQLDTPTATRFVELSTSYQFHFTEVENAYMYNIEVRQANDTVVGEYHSVSSPFTLLLTVMYLPHGSYKFRVQARAGEGTVYRDSEWSAWKTFSVI